MLSYLLALCLVVIILLAVSLRRAYSVVPAKELKRRAEAGDPLAVTLWRAVAYGPSLRLFLWLVVGFAAAGCVVLLARVAPPILGFIAVALLLWATFAWLPGAAVGNGSLRVAATLTPAIAWLVGTLDPVLRMITDRLDRRASHLHTKVYVREDLLEMIERQKSQVDNQLSIEELDLAANALRFGDKRVRDILIPRKEVRTVDVKDTVSPVFLDELHKTEHGYFPVYEKSKDNFVGLLYLRDLTDISEGKGAKGKVKDHMQPGVVYVHEADSLADALHAFYLSKKPLFIVTNSFEEYAGILTIEDILHALLGKPGDYDFDQHEDKKAVAAKHTKREKQIDEVIDETTDEVAPGSTDEPEPSTSSE